MKAQTKQKIKTTFETVTFLSIMVVAVAFFEWFGAIGVVLMALVLAAYMMWRSREAIYTGMQSIETRIWGKPLDKDMWEQEELKNTKVKFVWKKKRNSSNQ